MVVSLKKLLNAGSLQLCDMLKHLLRVCIFPLAIRVFCIEIVLRYWWDKWSLDLLIIKCVPVKAAEPVVVLQDLWTFLAESVAGFSLNQPVDEVSRLIAPASRDFSLTNFDLLRKNMVSDFFSVLAMVRSLTKHALICNDTHSEVVDRNSMILATHNLWCHVTRCS